MEDNAVISDTVCFGCMFDKALQISPCTEQCFPHLLHLTPKTL